MSKKIQVSPDGSTWYTLPGNKGTFAFEAGQIKDTIFGQDFESNQTGIISWTIDSNGLYKGFAGYVTKIMKSGTATVMTGEAMSLVSGKTYKVTAASKSALDRTTAAVIKDNGVSVASNNIEDIDYLFGRVTFASGYTPTGPITIDGKYLPLTQVAGANAFTLTQTAVAIDNTDYETAQGNNGFRTYEYGLRTVSLSLNGIYKPTNGFQDILSGRAEAIIEINVDGSGKSVARGFFKPTTTSQEGNVGELETDSIDFTLAVPEGIPLPFRWIHDAGTTLSLAIRTCLDSWEDGDLIGVNYLADGETGKEGDAIITDLSLSGGLEAMNEFTVKFQGSDQPEVTP